MSDIRGMLNSFNTIIDNNYKTLEHIKRKYGIVKELIPNTDSAKVRVKIRDLDKEDDEEETESDIKKTLLFLNKTGEKLRVGDHVIIYYWQTISDGYVAIKIGLSEEPPHKRNLQAYFAYSMTDDLDTLQGMTQNIHYISFNPEFVPFDEWVGDYLRNH